MWKIKEFKTHEEMQNFINKNGKKINDNDKRKIALESYFNWRGCKILI